jgi:radical SAM protein with 4Fe4S-binding SPASM domain
MNPKFTDQLNYISKLNFRRFTNALKLFISYHLSRRLRKPLHWGMPMSISVEPTTSCNLRCPECPSGLRSFSRPTGMLSTELFEKVVEELKGTLTYLLLYFQGEPYLHPEFAELIRLAHERNIYTCTSTNAHFLNDKMARKTVESGLDRLIISIDGTTQQTYESYRVGGKLEKVIEGTKKLVEWKKKLKSKTPHLVFQFLVVKPNEHQLQEVEALAKELEVDEVSFKSAQIYDYQNGSPLIPDNKKYSRYRQNADGTYSIKNKLLNQCWKMWHSCVVTWDGKVVPCCFDKDAKYTLGNAAVDNFKEIWHSESYQHFRQQLLISRKEVDICKNCTEGLKIGVD